MNKIEYLKPGELLTEGQLAEMDSFFMTEGYRPATGIYTLLFGVKEQEWLDFKASVPRGAHVHHLFYWTYDPPDTGEDDPEAVQAPAKKKAEKPGTDENGRYWQRMEYPGNYYAVPGLAEVLQCQPIEAEVNRAIRTAFEVATRRQISPEELEAWAESNNLSNLVTVSRTAQAAASRKTSAQEVEG